MDNSRVTKLVDSMDKNGYIGDPLPLAVNKTTGRAWLQDGNHRAAALIRLGIEWIPIKLDHKNVYKDYRHELFYQPVPGFYTDIDDWTQCPTASELEFK